MRDLAQPVATMRTMQLVGLPEERWEGYAALAHVHDTTRHDDPRHQMAEEGLRPLRQDLAAVAEERRSHPREDDLVTALVHTEVDGRRLSEREITDIMLFIIMAGIDTTKAAIGNMLLYLSRDPAARDALVSDPGRIRRAIEELLRYETSVPALARHATRDCVVGGQHIRKGEKLLLLWASANRDEEVFPEPHRVILDRLPQHLAFGKGVHSCLGSTLARAEIRITLEEVLWRLPDYKVIEEEIVGAQTIGMLYGKLAIPIEFSPGRPEVVHGAGS
jgi:cytochrome P450